MSACIGSALLGTAYNSYGQAETGNTVRMERLEKENQELKSRLESLEAMMKKEGLGRSSNAGVRITMNKDPTARWEECRPRCSSSVLWKVAETPQQPNFL